MKLQTKFNLAIGVIFSALAIGIAALTIYEVNALVIRLAENRVKIYMRAAWEIHDGKIARTRAALEVLAQDRAVLDVLTHGAAVSDLRPALEAVRRTQKMDILNLISPDGKVLLRTRPPYNYDDFVATDPLVKQAIATRQASAGNILMEQERLDVEGGELIERVLAVANEPRGIFSGAAVPVLADGKLVGVLEMGSLLNGATEKVDFF